MEKLTQKRLNQAELICKEFGYWSKEVNDFVSAFTTYSARLKLHQHLYKFR